MKGLRWAFAVLAVGAVGAMDPGVARADLATLDQPRTESAAAVPETVAVLLLGTALAGVIGGARRKHPGDGTGDSHEEKKSRWR